MVNNRKIHLAYCAGLFDGEGCITVRRWQRKDGRLRHELHVEMKQVRPDCINFIASVLGGRVTFRARTGKMRGYAGEWVWAIDSVRAAKALRAMRPYFLLKADEADLAIAFQRVKLRRDNGRSFKLGLTQAELDERDIIWRKLQALKRTHNNPAVQAEYAAHRPLSLPVPL